jgi:hypothetical protein
MGLPFSFIGVLVIHQRRNTSCSEHPNDRQDPIGSFVKDRNQLGSTDPQLPIRSIRNGLVLTMAARFAYLALGQPSSTGTGVVPYASQGTSGGFTFIDQS